eukprot:m.223060 g.223060  ORF g.223060 m.223060 type:complete len:635 (-) comp19195_c0_seq1:194-2098(-)
MTTRPTACPSAMGLANPSNVRLKTHASPPKGLKHIQKGCGVALICIIVTCFVQRQNSNFQRGARSPKTTVSKRVRKNVAAWETASVEEPGQASLNTHSSTTHDMRFLDHRDKQWGCCVSITNVENGCQPCLQLQSIRIHVPSTYDYTSPIQGTHLSTLGNNKLKEVLGNWIGTDRMEARNALFVSVGNKANCSRSKAETENWELIEPFMENACWKRLSNEAAYADTRGLVMADLFWKSPKTRGPGLGNQLFGAAAALTIALQLGRVPVVGCSSCFVDSMFKNFHCIEKELLNADQRSKIALTTTDLAYQRGLHFQQSVFDIHGNGSEANINLRGYHQSLLSFQDYYPAVCAALRPAAGLQQRTEEYLRHIFSSTPAAAMTHRATDTPYTVSKTVAMHVRRGDYAEHANTLGLLTHTYYQQALLLIKERLTGSLVVPQTRGHVVPNIQLHVVVFTAESSVPWCISTLAPRLRNLAATVHCANTSDIALGASGTRQASSMFPQVSETKTATQLNKLRCQGEEIDLFALSAFDFVVLANSTFSFWAQFFHTCRMRIVDWWSAATAMQVMQRRHAPSHDDPADALPRAPDVSPYVMPPFWRKDEAAEHTASARGRPRIFSFLNTDTMIVDIRPADLFV